MSAGLPAFLTPEDRRALDVFTTLLPGPYRLLVQALDADQGYCLAPAAGELTRTPLHELRHLRVGWWASLEEAQVHRAQLQGWLDQRAVSPWSAPAQQTVYGQTLTIDPGNPLAGYQERRWFSERPHNTPVPARAVAEGVGRMVRILKAISLQGAAQARRLAAQTQDAAPDLQQLEPDDHATFAPLLQARFHGWHGQWGVADLWLSLAGQPERKVTCEAVAYLCPCLAFGLVSAFTAETTLIFSLTLRDINHGATLAGHWDDDPQANLLAFRPAGLFAMNVTTFGEDLKAS